MSVRCYRGIIHIEITLSPSQRVIILYNNIKGKMGQCFALRLLLSTKSASSFPNFMVTILTLLPTNDRHQ